MVYYLKEFNFNGFKGGLQKMLNKKGFFYIYVDEELIYYLRIINIKFLMFRNVDCICYY